MRYYARKIFFFILTVWAAATLNFFIPRLQGGDPALAIVQRIQGQSVAVDQRQVEAVRLMLGVPDSPLLTQYVDYMVAISQFRFGVSYSYLPYTVGHMIKDTMWWTILLVGVTQVIAFVVGTLIGTWAAYKRNGTFDSGVTLGATFIGNLPSFWLALLLIYIFAFQLGWFPDGGAYSGDAAQGWNWAFIKDVAYHAVMPCIALLFFSTIGPILGMRNTMVQTLGEEYTRMARAKGLSQARIALMYGARNAILPNITGFAIGFGALMGGAVFIENVFDYPGMGRLMLDALQNQDFPLMQAIFLLTTVGVLTANFIVDLLYGVIDPRVRRGGEE